MHNTLKDNLALALPLHVQRRASRWPEPIMNFIVAYDIADPKRLSRVANTLERSARRVQKSVFMFTGSRRELEGVINDLVMYMEVSEDRLQAWPIRTSTRACRIDAGQTVPDSGVALVIADEHWTVIEAMDDQLSHEPLIIE